MCKNYSLLLTLLLASLVFSLNLELTVTEPSSVSRIGEYVTVGVPLPEGIVKNSGELSITDGSSNIPCQFRVMERWVKDNSIKWLLCDFQTDIEADASRKFYLIDKSSPQNGSITFTEDNDNIIVNTGAARFTLSKESFNLFKEVVVGGSTLIDTGSATNSFITSYVAGDTIIAGDSGTYHLSDSLESLTVEETGTVRLVVLARGIYKSPLPGYFGYDIRFYFYSNQSYVRVEHSLRNFFGAAQSYLYDFRDCNLTFDLNLTGNLTYLLGEDGSSPGYILNTGDTLSLYQESGGDEGWEYENTWAENSLESWGISALKRFRGYKVNKGGAEVATGNYPQGWGAVQASTGGLMVAVKDFKWLHPKALDFTDAKAIVRLWPKYYSIDHFLEWKKGKSHDVYLYFHSGNLSANECENWNKRFQRPLTAHASADWYANSLAIEQYLGKPQTEFKLSVPKTYSGRESGIYRIGGSAWSNVNSGGFHANAAPNAQDYYYTGEYNRFEYLGQKARFHQMLPIWYENLHVVYGEESDNAMLNRLEQYIRNGRAIKKYNYVKCFRFLCCSNQAPDYGHYALYPLYGWYFLTGDLRTLDAIKNLAGWIKTWLYKTHGVNDMQGPRGHGWSQHILTHAWRITGDSSFVKYADWNLKTQREKLARGDRNTRTILSLFKPMPRGMNWRSTSNKYFMLSIFINGMHYYHTATGDEDARDLIWGATRSFLYYGNYAKGIGISDVKKNYWNEDPPSSASYHPRYLLPISLGYIYTGNSGFLQRAGEMWEDAYQKSGELFGANQAYLYLRDFPRSDTIAPGAINDLTVASGGTGEVMLTFTVPGDNSGFIKEYIAKYDTFTIINTVVLTPPEIIIEDSIAAYWVGIKNSLHAFWQTDNCPDEPSPHFSGADTIYIHNLDTSKTYNFAIKTYDPSNNLSPVSNVVTAKPGTSGAIHDNRTGVGIEAENGEMEGLFGFDVYPNPFNPVVNIVVSHKELGVSGLALDLSIKIFNVKGILVENLSQTANSLQLTPNSFTWNAKNHPSGIYIVRVKVGNRILNRKVMLIR